MKIGIWIAITTTITAAILSVGISVIYGVFFKDQSCSELIDQFVSYTENRFDDSNAKLYIVKEEVIKVMDQMKGSLLESVKTNCNSQPCIPKNPTHHFAGTDNWMTFDEAVEYCTQKGGHLPMFNSKHNPNLQYETLLAKAKKEKYTRWWIGLKRSPSTKQFEWLDGTPLTFGRWVEDEPNNDGNENCVEVTDTPTIGWNDGRCQWKFLVVCAF